MAIAEHQGAELTETVYEPVSKGMPPIVPYWRSVMSRWTLIWETARSDLKAQHFDTVLGQIWLILYPIMMAAVWLVVRTAIRPAGTDESRNDVISHLILGIFMFQYFSAIVTSGMSSLVSNKQMILNSAFPRGVFPVSALVGAAIEMLPTLVVYALVHLLLGQPVGWVVLWFPIYLALLTLFGFGLGLGLSVLYVYFRDTKNFVQLLLRLAMFTTPILWTVQEAGEALLRVMQFQPMYSYWAAFEYIFDGQDPGARLLFQSVVVSAVTFVVGMAIFLRKERDVAIWL